jgi:hypothetical protein
MQAHVEQKNLVKIEIKLHTWKNLLKTWSYFNGPKKQKHSQTLTQNKKKKTHIPLPPFQKKKILGLWGVWYILISCM